MTTKSETSRRTVIFIVMVITTVFITMLMGCAGIKAMFTTAQFRVTNYTGQTLDYVYFKYSGTTNWGNPINAFATDEYEGLPNADQVYGKTGGKLNVQTRRFKTNSPEERYQVASVEANSKTLPSYAMLATVGGQQQIDEYLEFSVDIRAIDTNGQVYTKSNIKLSSLTPKMDGSDMDYSIDLFDSDKQ